MTDHTLRHAVPYTALTSATSPRLIFLRLTILSAPAYILGIALGNTYMPLAVPLACIVAGYEILLLTSGQRKASSSAFAMTLPFVAVVVIGSLALLISPYRADAVDRGIRQVAGLSAMIFMLFAVIHLSERLPLDYLRLVRLFTKVIGAIGWLAVTEFVVNNLAGDREIDFSVIAKATGAFGYFHGGSIYKLMRATSTASEPSMLGLTMVTAFGLAALRLGAAGRSSRAALRRIVPRWAAVGTVCGLLTSLSLTGYSGVLATLAALVMLKMPRRLILICVAILTIAMIAAGSALVEMISLSRVPVLDRLQFFVEFAGSGSSAIDSFRTDDLSATIVITNALVALRDLQLDPLLGAGFGAHPVAYFNAVPALAYAHGYALNNEDASGLGLRLISETGLLGIMAFVAGVVHVAMRLRRLAQHGDPVAAALAWGYGASLVGTTLMHLARFGNYYWTPYWVMLSLAAGAAGWRYPPAVRVGLDKRNPLDPVRET